MTCHKGKQNIPCIQQPIQEQKRVIQFIGKRYITQQADDPWLTVLMETIADDNHQETTCQKIDTDRND
jgi:hypothetical protein